MDIENLVKSTVPDFMDVEVTVYVEEMENGTENDIVRVKGEHDGESYAFEISSNGEDISDEIRVMQLQNSYKAMVEAVIENELN